jgi:hypothetical protein
MSATIERERDTLIDHAALAVHQNLLNVLSERVSVANGLRNKAQAAYDEAQDKYQAAVFGRGGDAHELKITLEAAARRLSVESERSDAARAELQHANARTDIVRGIAHRKVYEDGIRRRIAASARWDAGKKEMEAAEADRATANAQMRGAMQAGLPDVHGALDGPDPMNSEAQERAHWHNRNVNPDRPSHPARMPPEQLTDEQARAQGLVKMANGEQSTYVHPSAVAAHVSNGWKDLSHANG